MNRLPFNRQVAARRDGLGDLQDYVDRHRSSRDPAKKRRAEALEALLGDADRMADLLREFVAFVDFEAVAPDRGTPEAFRWARLIDAAREVAEAGIYGREHA